MTTRTHLLMLVADVLVYAARLVFIFVCAFGAVLAAIFLASLLRNEVTSTPTAALLAGYGAWIGWRKWRPAEIALEQLKWGCRE